MVNGGQWLHHLRGMLMLRSTNMNGSESNRKNRTLMKNRIDKNRMRIAESFQA